MWNQTIYNVSTISFNVFNVTLCVSAELKATKVSQMDIVAARTW